MLKLNYENTYQASIKSTAGTYAYTQFSFKKREQVGDFVT